MLTKGIKTHLYTYHILCDWSPLCVMVSPAPNIGPGATLTPLLSIRIHKPWLDSLLFDDDVVISVPQRLYPMRQVRIQFPKCRLSGWSVY